MNHSPEVESLRSHAIEEARRLGHGYVGTEHLLLAVIREETSPACKALIALDIDPLDLKSQIESYVVISTQSPGDEEIPFAPRAKRTLDWALEEAGSRGAESAGPEHVLLALARDEDGVAAQILEAFGVDYASINRKI